MKKTEFLEDLEDEFLACRDLRHAWDPPDWYMEPDGQVLRVTQCLRCKTQRIDVMNYAEQSGVETRQYLYPQGYRYHRDKEERPLTGREIRDEAQSRAKLVRIKSREDIHFK